MTDDPTMKPLTITFAKAKSEGACDAGYRKMGEHLGGITKYGRNTPVPIETIFDVCGLHDAIWALIAVKADRELRLFAADCAERVLPIYEKQYPDDQRPRQVIEAARAFTRGEISDAARDAAGDAAAWSAAIAALAAARVAAARDAAWAAEQKWQDERLREYLRGER